MANINLTDSSNIEVVQNGSTISLDLTTTGVIGDLTSLTTSDTSSLVSAINELHNSMYFKNGDTFINNGAFDIPGIMSGSNKIAAFDLILPKKIDNISTISCSEFTGIIMGVSGTATPSSQTNYAATTGYTLTITAISSNIIRIRIAATTAWGNITNNTPCQFVVSNISLSFS